MLINHKFCYSLDGLFLITEEERFDLEPAELPFNLFKDFRKITTGYIRWSDQKQSSGHSLLIQEREVLSRARLEGFEVVVMFIERATSAYHKPAQRREKMQEMKNYILNTQNVNATIFYDESRVTRLIEDFSLNILGPIKEQKPFFKLYSTKTNGEWDENNPYVQVKLTMAHEESEKKSEKAFDYHKAAMTSTSPNRPGSRHPFGYSKSTNKDGYIETDENAPIVKLIFYLYSFGYSDLKIATLLKEADVPPPSTDNSWSDSSVRYILNNLWYTGSLAWFSRTSFEDSRKKPLNEFLIFNNHHDPLIGPNLWSTTQFFRRLKNNKGRMDSPFILRDLVSCNSCNGKLAVKNMTPANSQNTYMYYKCPTCKQKVNKDILHKLVLKDFSSRWAREINHHSPSFNKTINSWKKTLKNQIQQHVCEMDQLKYKSSLLKKDEDFYYDLQESFKLQLNSEEKQLLQCHNALKQLDLLQNDAMLYELIDRFKHDLYHYQNQEIRSLLLLAIKKIKFDFHHNTIQSLEYRLTPYIEMETFMDTLNKPL